MRDAIEFHLEGLRDSGQPIPEPSHLTATYVQVAACQLAVMITVEQRRCACSSA